MIVQKGVSEQIRELLKSSPRGMMISEIARMLDVSRNTVAKYLDVFLASGQVEMQEFGSAKVYSLTRRIPISSMMDSATEAFLIFDSNLIIVQANEKVELLFQEPLNEVIGQPLFNLKLQSVSLTEILSKVEELLKGRNISVRTRFQIKSVDRYFSCKIIPSAFDDGEPGLTISIEEVTERVRTQEALRTSEARLRAIMEAVPAAIYMLDSDGVILFVNRSLQGFDVESLIGAKIFDIVPEEHHEVTREMLRNTINTGKTQRVDNFELETQNEHLWVDVICTPVDPSLQPAAFILVVLDITHNRMNDA